VADGIELAAQAIDRGHALRTLETLAQVSKEPAAV
jgi:hypothetical protein